ncbi:MAG TPA: hypothetical protein VF978_07350 [Gemmatimonadales bacterium]
MSGRAFGLAAFLALAVPQAAVAQDPRLGRLDAETRTAVTALLDSARAGGLPTEPLLDRALEGAAKGAAKEQIVAATRRLAGHLARARDALGTKASPAELEAGAAALRAGVDSTMLSALRRSRPRQSLTVPLAVLADLVTSGVPADTAARAVLALAPFVGDDALIEFRRDVDRDIALGAPPAGAAMVRGGSILDAFSQGDRPSNPPPGPRRP